MFSKHVAVKFHQILSWAGHSLILIEDSQRTLSGSCLVSQPSLEKRAHPSVPSLRRWSWVLASSRPISVYALLGKYCNWPVFNLTGNLQLLILLTLGHYRWLLLGIDHLSFHSSDLFTQQPLSGNADLSCKLRLPLECLSSWRISLLSNAIIKPLPTPTHRFMDLDPV